MSNSKVFDHIVLVKSDQSRIRSAVESLALQTEGLQATASPASAIAIDDAAENSPYRTLFRNIPFFTDWLTFRAGVACRVAP